MTKPMPFFPTHITHPRTPLRLHHFTIHWRLTARTVAHALRPPQTWRAHRHITLILTIPSPRPFIGLKTMPFAALQRTYFHSLPWQTLPHFYLTTLHSMDLRALTIHSSSRHALAFTPCTTLSLHDTCKYQIYADGSHQAYDDAWANVILATNGDPSDHNYDFAGVAAAHIDENLFGLFDSVNPGNNDAELVAISYELAFFIKHAPCATRLHLHTDSNLYATMLQHQPAPLSAIRLTSTVYTMSQLLTPRLVTHHVAAHTKHPWNELADVAAATAAERRFTAIHTQPQHQWIDLNLNVWPVAWARPAAYPPFTAAVVHLWRQEVAGDLADDRMAAPNFFEPRCAQRLNGASASMPSGIIGRRECIQR